MPRSVKHPEDFKELDTWEHKEGEDYAGFDFVGYVIPNHSIEPPFSHIQRYLPREKCAIEQKTLTKIENGIQDKYINQNAIDVDNDKWEPQMRTVMESLRLKLDLTDLDNPKLIDDDVKYDVASNIMGEFNDDGGWKIVVWEEKFLEKRVIKNGLEFLVTEEIITWKMIKDPTVTTKTTRRWNFYAPLQP